MVNEDRKQEKTIETNSKIETKHFYKIHEAVVLVTQTTPKKPATTKKQQSSKKVPASSKRKIESNFTGLTTRSHQDSKSAKLNIKSNFTGLTTRSHQVSKSQSKDVQTPVKRIFQVDKNSSPQPPEKRIRRPTEIYLEYIVSTKNSHENEKVRHPKKEKRTAPSTQSSARNAKSQQPPLAHTTKSPFSKRRKSSFIRATRKRNGPVPRSTKNKGVPPIKVPKPDPVPELHPQPLFRQADLAQATQSSQQFLLDAPQPPVIPVDPTQLNIVPAQYSTPSTQTQQGKRKRGRPRNAKSQPPPFAHTTKSAFSTTRKSPFTRATRKRNGPVARSTKIKTVLPTKTKSRQPKNGKDGAPKNGKEPQPKNGKDTQPKNGKGEAPKKVQEAKPKNGKDTKPKTGKGEAPKKVQGQQTENGKGVQPKKGKVGAPKKVQGEKNKNGKGVQPKKGKGGAPKKGQEAQPKNGKGGAPKKKKKKEKKIYIRPKFVPGFVHPAIRLKMLHAPSQPALHEDQQPTSVLLDVPKQLAVPEDPQKATTKATPNETIKETKDASTTESPQPSTSEDTSATPIRRITADAIYKTVGGVTVYTVCIRFNVGLCKRGDKCSFQHKCSTCGKWGHPKIACPNDTFEPYEETTDEYDESDEVVRDVTIQGKEVPTPSVLPDVREQPAVPEDPTPTYVLLDEPKQQTVHEDPTPTSVLTDVCEQPTVLEHPTPTSVLLDEPKQPTVPEDPTPTSVLTDVCEQPTVLEDPIPTSVLLDEPKQPTVPEDPTPTSVLSDVREQPAVPEDPTPTSVLPDVREQQAVPEDPTPTSVLLDEPKQPNVPEDPTPTSILLDKNMEIIIRKQKETLLQIQMQHETPSSPIIIGIDSAQSTSSSHVTLSRHSSLPPRSRIVSSTSRPLCETPQKSVFSKRSRTNLKHTKSAPALLHSVIEHVTPLGRNILPSSTSTPQDNHSPKYNEHRSVQLRRELNFGNVESSADNLSDVYTFSTPKSTAKSNTPQQQSTSRISSVQGHATQNDKLNNFSSSESESDCQNEDFFSRKRTKNAKNTTKEIASGTDEMENAYSSSSSSSSSSSEESQEDDIEELAEFLVEVERAAPPPNPVERTPILEKKAGKNYPNDSVSKQDLDIGWRHADDPHQQPFLFPFDEQVGLVDPSGINQPPEYYFNLIMDTEMWSGIAKHTNAYAQAKKKKVLGDSIDEFTAKADFPDFKENSRILSWIDVDPVDIQCVFAHLIVMGLVGRSDMNKYWSRKPLTRIPFFGHFLRRNQFQLIYWNLHVNYKEPEKIPEKSPDKNRGKQKSEKKSDLHPLHKVKPLLTMMNTNFTNIYKPGREIAYDETCCPWRGRVKFRTFNAKKPHKFHMKFYTACESSTGYLLGTDLYYGDDHKEMYKDTKHNNAEIGIITKQVLGHLSSMEMLGKGHHIYTDNFYTSPHLLDELHLQDTYLCGTVKLNRLGMPPSFAKANPDRVKLDHGEYVFRWSYDTVDPKVNEEVPHSLCLKWEDRKTVTFLSSIHPADTCKVKRKRKKQGEEWEKWKPLVALEYTKHMGGADTFGQLALVYENFLRKTMSWSKKIVLYLLHVCLTNAFILNKKYGSQKLENTEYRYYLASYFLRNFTVAKGLPVDDLFFKPLWPRGSIDTVVPNGKQSRMNPNDWHFIEETVCKDPCSKKKRPPRECIACNYKKSDEELLGEDAFLAKSLPPKRSSFQCDTCKVCLCIGECFKQYHLNSTNHKKHLILLRLQQQVVKDHNRKQKAD